MLGGLCLVELCLGPRYRMAEFSVSERKMSLVVICIL